jgi:hypothetical protein
VQQLDVYANLSADVEFSWMGELPLADDRVAIWAVISLLGVIATDDGYAQWSRQIIVQMKDETNAELDQIGRDDVESCRRAFEAIQGGRDVNHHAVRTGCDVLLGL